MAGGPGKQLANPCSERTWAPRMWGRPPPACTCSQSAPCSARSGGARALCPHPVPSQPREEATGPSVSGRGASRRNSLREKEMRLDICDKKVRLRLKERGVYPDFRCYLCGPMMDTDDGLDWSPCRWGRPGLNRNCPLSYDLRRHLNT